MDEWEPAVNTPLGTLRITKGGMDRLASKLAEAIDLLEKVYEYELVDYSGDDSGANLRKEIAAFLKRV